LSGHADWGFKFPRTYGSGAASESGGIESLDFGPMKIPSLVAEKPKFMDIRQLKSLLADRSQSLHIQDVIAEFIQAEQQLEASQRLVQELNRSGRCAFNTGSQ